MGHPYSRVRSQKTLYPWRRIGLTQDVKEYTKITPQSVNGRYVPLSDCPTISLGKGQAAQFHLLIAMRRPNSLRCDQLGDRLKMSLGVEFVIAA